MALETQTSNTYSYSPSGGSVTWNSIIVALVPGSTTIGAAVSFIKLFP